MNALLLPVYMLIRFCASILSEKWKKNPGIISKKYARLVEKIGMKRGNYVENKNLRQYYIKKEALTDCCAALLERVGVPWEEAETIAEGLVLAELRGVGSHGMIRMQQYLRAFSEGGIQPRAHWRVLRESQSTMTIDARGSSGFVIGKSVMQWLTEKAAVSGLAIASVGNSSHFGMAAYYAMMPLQHGMIGMAICNTAPYMAPWGGSEAFFGTNPLAIGIPAGGYPPVVLDMATTVAARGKIVLAEKEGRSIPEGWALDPRGVMTTDPAAALLGTLLPAGGPKGYGLALIIDVLSGLLSGGVYGPHVGNSARTDVPQGAGQCFLVLDVRKFQPLDLFLEEIDSMIREIKASPKAEGVEEIYLPGEIEFRLSEQRTREGIPLSEEVHEMLQKLCRIHGVEMPAHRTHPWNSAVTV